MDRKEATSLRNEQTKFQRPKNRGKKGCGTDAKKIEQEGEPKKATSGKEKVVMRRPRETGPGNSQKIEVR